MGLKDSFKNFFNLDEDIEKHFDSEDQQNTRYRSNMTEAETGVYREREVFNEEEPLSFPEVIQIESYGYEDVQTITDHIKENHLVIFNVRNVPKTEAKPMIDFMSGVVYALDGQITKLEPNIFLCGIDEDAIRIVKDEYKQDKVLVR